MAEDRGGFVLVAGKRSECGFWEVVRRIEGISLERFKVDRIELLEDEFNSEFFRVAVLSSGLLDNYGIGKFASFNKLRNRKVIVAGGYESREDEFLLRQAGVYCFLLLPDESDLLIGAVKSALNASVC